MGWLFSARNQIGHIGLRDTDPKEVATPGCSENIFAVA
jgi:hypothetical protein